MKSPEEMEPGRVTQGSGGTILEGESATRLFQMLAVRSILRREQAGLKRGSGRSVKSQWAEAFGLDKRASYAAVIDKVEERIRQLNEKIDRGGQLPEEEGDPPVPESGAAATQS